MVKNRFLFVAMLFAVLSLGMVSCDNDKGNEPDDPTQGEQTEQNGSTENNGGGEETPEPETPTPADPYNGHAYVDLGLPSGLKWATCNVGATKPEEYGNYYAWGETTPKTTYASDTYKWGNAWHNAITKYCTRSTYGTVDNKTILDKEDDAAAVNMGGSWRIPTHAEQDELRKKCTWTWTTLNGVNGYNVEGPNGNSIFLPAAGYRRNSDLDDAGSLGCYWSSEISMGYPDSAYGFHFESDESDGVCNYYFAERKFGFSVRGVFSE